MAIAERRFAHAVENCIDITAPAEKVFDYVTDVPREREWSHHLRSVDQVTPGRARTGTRYRVRYGRTAGSAIIIENTAFDRPNSWSAVSSSPRLDVHFWGQVTEVPGNGCWLAVRTELEPHGALRLLSPLLRGMLRHSWRRDLRTVKGIIEH